MLRKICEKGRLHQPECFTNHSLRQTAATSLYQANVDEQLIAEVTGHWSSAFRQYKVTSDKQRADISDTLQRGVHDCEGPDAKGISDDADADVELEEPAAKWKYQPFTIQDVRAETGSTITINVNDSK